MTATINLDLEKPIANLFDSFNSNAFKERLYSFLAAKKNFDEIETLYALATNKLKTSEEFDWILEDKKAFVFQSNFKEEILKKQIKHKIAIFFQSLLFPFQGILNPLFTHSSYEKLITPVSLAELFKVTVSPKKQKQSESQKGFVEIIGDFKIQDETLEGAPTKSRARDKLTFSSHKSFLDETFVVKISFLEKFIERFTQNDQSLLNYESFEKLCLFSTFDDEAYLDAICDRAVWEGCLFNLLISKENDISKELGLSFLNQKSGEEIYKKILTQPDLSTRLNHLLCSVINRYINKQVNEKLDFITGSITEQSEWKIIASRTVRFYFSSINLLVVLKLLEKGRADLILSKVKDVVSFKRLFETFECEDAVHFYFENLKIFSLTLKEGKNDTRYIDVEFTDV